MRRRRLPPDLPVSSSVWCRRLGVLAVALAAAAGVASHGGLSPEGTLALLGLALVSAVLTLGLAVLAIVAIWRTGRPGVLRLLVGSALAAGLLAYPAWLAVAAAGSPPINDISTDRTDPPAFSLAPKAVAGRRGSSHAPPSAATLDAQTRAYPDVAPLELDVDPQVAYAAALKLVKARHWTVLDAEPPTPPRGAGHIDAVARTPLMGFQDDVTIRIAGHSAGTTRIDLRSASRVGVGDLGANAARIAAFVADLDDAVDED